MLTNRKYRGYRQTVDTEDTGGQWIQGNSRYSGYWETVDIVDADGEWRGYRRAVDTGKQ